MSLKRNDTARSWKFCLQLKILKLLRDPYEIEDIEWIDDLTVWSPVEFGEIYSYLVETPGQFTKEGMKAYKRLDAFKYYIR